MKTNERKIKFAHLVHAGKSQTAAYTGAGYSSNQAKKTINRNAAALMNDAVVQGELARLRERSASKAEYTRQELIQSLIAEVRFDPRKMDVEDLRGVMHVKKTVDKEGNAVVMYEGPDKNRARDMLCKLERWYEGAGKEASADEDLRNKTDEELAEELEEVLKDLRGRKA